MDGKTDIGMIGLAVMGENLALNMASKGFKVSVFNRTVEKVERFVAGRGNRENIVGTFSLEEFVESIGRPRKIMLMVKAGPPVDATIEKLLPLLDEGDVVIDGGNSYFKDTIRRTGALAEKGILFVGAGVSGGEEGALKGPSIMPGGNPDAWPLVKPILRTIAAKVADGSPCCEWVGPDGAGHYVKMVHNGIEYGDMQMISEAYAIMRGALEMSAEDIADVFDEWNRGELDSYLIEITREVLRKTDPETGKPMVDIILDAAGQKGTGKWTSQNALDIGAPTPTVAEAVFARCVSALKEERVAASKTLRGPATSFSGNRSEFLADIGKALYASKICSYAQGFQLLEMAGREYGWDFRHGDIALMWRGGCIIRAKFLGDIKKAFDDDPKLPNLLLAPFFKNAIDEAQDSWRNVVASSARMGIPAPAFASALAYYDSYRSERLPANLIQAQRDYFGAHTYERIDRPRGEFFHSDWPRD